MYIIKVILSKQVMSLICACLAQVSESSLSLLLKQRRANRTIWVMASEIMTSTETAELLIVMLQILSLFAGQKADGTLLSGLRMSSLIHFFLNHSPAPCFSPLLHFLINEVVFTLSELFIY